MTSKTYHKMKNIVLSTLLICIAVLLIAHSAAVTVSISSAVYRCINVMIPSLFAFLAVTDLLVSSGGYIILSYIMAPISLLLGLPISCGAVFAVSNVGGYPLGAAMISSMYDRGALDKRSAARLLSVCYNGGPAFFSGAVGLTVFGSARAGMLIFLSIVLANAVYCAVYSRIFKIETKSDRGDMRFSAEMLTDSVAAAGRSLFNICTMILVFSAIASLLSPFISAAASDDNARVLISSAMEISALSDMVGSPYKLLPAVAAVGAFGGICVVMQVYTIVGGRFSLIPFIASRLICPSIAMAICSLISPYILPKAIPVYAQTEFIVNLNNFAPSFCLIMMIFLTVLQKRLAFSDNVCYNE